MVRSLDCQHALDLAQVLERMTLRVPQLVRRAWKVARPKKTGMTYDQAAAIVAEGLRRGTRRHQSVALGVAAQFELTLRQSDVIGEWERIDRGVPVRHRYYRDLYRDVADAAGVPRTVWSMHARHGGATESQQAGASLA